MKDAFATPTNIPDEGSSVPAASGGEAAETPGTVTLGRYLLGAKHAEGGLGEVFRAIDTELNRDVALKRIKALNPDADRCRRFLVEGEVTGRLEHPGVVPVYGLGHDAAGRPFYVMRFVRGETLQEAIQRFHAADRPGRDPGERSKALRELLGQFVATCNTMAYAHSRGILHRDLKPSNIMLGPYGETLVVDWGLAKPFTRSEEARSVGEETLAVAADDSQQTQQGQAVGTPQYMSPEQAAGRWSTVGPASDVYSLGATLYHLLAGKIPFDGRNVGEVLDKVRRGVFPPPSQRKPDVPPALEAICLKAMALEPEDRYPSALDLAAEVKNWLADEPVGVWPETWRLRTWRWVKRHPAQAAAGVATLLLSAVVTAAAGFVLAAQESEREAKTRADLIALHSQQEVVRALDEAQQHRQALHRQLADPLQVHRLLSEIDRWDRIVKDARQAWQRAQGVAGSNMDVVGPAILARLQQVDSDLSNDERDFLLARNLDAIRLQAGISTQGAWHRVSAGTKYRDVVAQANYDLVQDFATAGTKYRDFFTQAQYDLVRQQPESLAAQMTASPLRYVLAAALDSWAQVSADQQLQALILAAARLADPAPWRDQVREPKMWSAARLQELAAAAQPGQQSPHVLLLLATQLKKAKQPERAAALLRLAVREHPRDFWLAFNLGNTVDDPVERAGYFHAALAIRPDSAAAHNNLGLALFHQKDLQGAIQVFHKAIALEPHSSAAHGNLGLVLRAGHDLDGAAQKFQEAIALDSRNANPHYNLGLILYGKKNFDAAVREFRTAVEIDPHIPMYHLGLGHGLREKQELAGAVQQFQAAITLDPEFIPGHEGLSYALILQKDYRQALTVCEKAVGFAPKNDASYLRYNGALAAVVLATGHGTDGADLPAIEKARLRSQAHGWLKAYLADCARWMESDATTSERVSKDMQRFQEQKYSDYWASVREAKKLAALSEAERSQWESLWTEVQELATKARSIFQK